jgi:hypothetical protein
MPRKYFGNGLIEKTRSAVDELPKSALTKGQMRTARHSPYASHFWENFPKIDRDHRKGVPWEDIIATYFRRPFPSRRTIQRLYQATLAANKKK